MEQNQDSPVYFTDREGKPLLLLQGAVDIFSAEQLHQAALQALERGEDVVVECAKTEQLGSAALQILLALKDGLRGRGKRLLLQGAPPHVLTQLQLTGLTSVLLPEETEI